MPTATTSRRAKASAAAPAAPPAPPVRLSPLVPLLAGLETELNGLFYEREDAIHTILTAVLARTHGFIEGEPGTGKSDLLETICKAITGGKYARFLMDRQMGKEDLFGAHDIATYLAGGGWTRDTSDTMVDAHMVLLDEIGRTGPAVMGSMLSIMNEGIYKPNGHWIKVPLISAWGASNSWIYDEMPAMADRFVINLSFEYIKEDNNFARLYDRACDGVSTQVATHVPLDMLQHAIDVEVPAVPIPRTLREAVQQLKSDLRAEQIVLSDRRWVKTAMLLRASAFLAGKAQADEDDLPVLRHVLWSHPNQRKTVERKVLSLTSPITKAALEFAGMLDEISATVDALRGKNVGDRATAGAKAQFELEQIQGRLTVAREEAHRSGRSVAPLDAVNKQVRDVAVKIFTDCMNLAPAAAAAAAAGL